MRNAHHIKTALKVFLLVAFFDQLTKWFMIHKIMMTAEPKYVASFLNLVMVRNKGVTFGLLNGGQPLPYMPYILSGVALLIVVVLGRWLLQTHSKMVAVGIGMVIGGAVGNVIDRIRDGAVLDFLDFHMAGHHWYAFNVADAGIVVGVGLLMLDSLVRAR